MPGLARAAGALLPQAAVRGVPSAGDVAGDGLGERGHGVVQPPGRRHRSLDQRLESPHSASVSTIIGPSSTTV